MIERELTSRELVTYQARIAEQYAAMYGMIAANEVRKSRGEALAYAEEAFREVQQEMQDMHDDLREEGYYCCLHGGTPAGEAANERNGLECPICERERS